MMNRKQNEKTIKRLCVDVPLRVFIAEPLPNGRFVVDRRPEDSQEELDEPQAMADAITGWKPQL